MVADGTITTRVSTVVALDGAAQMLATLRQGSLRGKAVIRI